MARHDALMDNGVGAFLRDRRARLSPQQAGLRPDVGRRRVTGLRREELAQLAGVSVDYYMRLEQGRATHVSDSVLDAVARALKLSPAEREHLVNLARPAVTLPATTDRPGADAQRRLLDMMVGVPALILGRSMEAVAWNAMAHEMFGLGDLPGDQRNIARLAFLDSRLRMRLRNSEELAAHVVAYLRLQLGRFPRDRALLDLIDDLSGRSVAFQRLWSAQDVRDGWTTVVELTHPVVGAMTLINVWLTLPDSPESVLVAYTVEAGSVSERRLQAVQEAMERV